MPSGPIDDLGDVGTQEESDPGVAKVLAQSAQRGGGEHDVADPVRQNDEDTARFVVITLPEHARRVYPLVRRRGAVGSRWQRGSVSTTIIRR